MAVLAIISAFLVAPLGVVFGAIGRRQTRRTGQNGKGLATAGLVLGVVFTLLGVGAIALGVIAAKSLTTSVAQAEVESQIGDQFQITTGHRPQQVSCAQDLPATLGATVACTVTNAGTTLPVLATVTSLDGATAHFSIDLVHPAPAPDPTSVPASASVPAFTSVAAPKATGAPVAAPTGGTPLVACTLFNLGALNTATGLTWTKSPGADPSACTITASNGNLVTISLVPTGGSSDGALSGIRSACDPGTFVPQTVADGGYTCLISGISSGGAVFAADNTLVVAAAVTFNGATPSQVQSALLDLLRSFTN